MTTQVHVKERAIVVGVGLKSTSNELVSESLSELVALTETAGAEVVGVTTQRLTTIVAATYIGAGKIAEIKSLAVETSAKTIVLDIPHLSGAQQRNLETEIKLKVLDRSQVILEIFAQRARSKEGQLQVELAILKDKLPRLIGEAIAGLSRLGGGIGTLGPGESKLEIDRRRIKEKIVRLKRELEVVKRNRALHRERRKTSKIPTVALVGYTNSGKSSVFNRLTKSTVMAADILFATLDPITHKCFLSEKTQVLLSDTVGFIHNLPTQLIEAFQATFEEVGEADILLHVMDFSHFAVELHAKTTLDLLKTLNLDKKPILHVYNKVDLCDEKRRQFQGVTRLPGSVVVSTKTGEGFDSLLAEIEKAAHALTEVYELFIPMDDHGLIYRLDRDGKVLNREDSPKVITLKVEMTQEALQRWSRFLTPPDLI